MSRRGVILYVSHTGAIGGGAEVVLLQTIRAASEAGWRCCVVCPPGALAGRLSGIAEEVRSFPLPALERRRHPVEAIRQWLAWMAAAFRVTLLILRMRPAIIHANSGVAVLIACLPAAITRRPLIWQQHDIVPPRRVNRLVLGRIAGRIARRVVCPSRAVAESVVHLGVPSYRVRVHYNCAAPEFFQPLPPLTACRRALGLPNEGIAAGVVARLTPKKGQLTFLDALAELRRRGVPIHGAVVGEMHQNGDREENRLYVSTLRERASSPDLAGHVSFLGFRRDMREVLGALDMLVMPSVNDPFPLAILEAFAAGVPVVASASGGHPEAVEDGRTGLLCVPGDMRDLARAMEQLIVNPDERAWLAANAREKAEREYSEEVLPERIGELYAEVVSVEYEGGEASEVVFGAGEGGGASEPLLTGERIVVGLASRGQPPLAACHRPPLSVLVPCFNNEDIIEDCLRSVRWADEVVVCDSFSTDRTLEIARRYADRIIQHVYVNSASQKNWAIPQLSHEWVLIVDTDERVSPALREEIERALRAPGDMAGFRMPRANYVFGRWLRHGGDWPDYQIRLFRCDAGRYQSREVHAHVLLNGPRGTLIPPLLHYPHRSFRSLWRVLLQRYTTWEAIEKRRQGVRFRWHQPFTRPAGAFVYRYVYKEGFRDGWQGLAMACAWTGYVCIAYMKLWGMERAASDSRATAASDGRATAAERARP